METSRPRPQVKGLRAQGFTLIELVLVIVLVGVLGALTTKIITFPINSYLDLARRTAMVDAADMSLRLLQRDIRRSLPNSVRISADGYSLELLHISDGGRYRANKNGNLGATAGLCSVGGDPANDVLDFTASDTCFEFMGSLQSLNPQATNGERVVVYNLGVAAADAYANNNSAVLQNAINANTLRFAATTFPFSSPNQRFHIVDTAITYRCDLINKQLLRYSNYAYTAVQTNVPSGAVGQLQVNNVSACSFVYTAGVATRAAQVQATITLTDARGESVTMFRQIHVDNVP